MSSEDRFLPMLERAMETGQWGSVIGTVFRCKAAAEEGRFCRCPDPILEAEGLMCHRCLLRNKAQEERVTAAHNAPHEYVVGRHDKFGMCDYCTRWRDDPIHTLGGKVETT